MRKKTSKKVKEPVKKPQLKDASTQTYRYIEHMPLPIIVDIKSEDESDDGNDNGNDNGNDFDMDSFSGAYEKPELILETLKIEIGDNQIVEEVHPDPVEELFFEEKICIRAIEPIGPIESIEPIAPITQATSQVNAPVALGNTSKKRTSSQAKRKTNGTKPKRTKKEKEPKQKKTKVCTSETFEMIDCSLCSFSCKRPSHLKRHMLMHTGAKPHHCEHCPKQFAQKTDLNRHLSIHAANYDFHCSSCGRGFADDESSKKHEQKCNTKRYICDICNYMTFSIGNLHLHKRKHTGERPFECMSCGKRFTRVAHLNQHVKLHANDFEMHCASCGRGFANEEEMLRHEVSCKNRMFQCHMCRDVHHRMDNLRRHIKITHMGIKDVLCEYCSKQFPAKSSLTKHIKFKHPERL